MSNNTFDVIVIGAGVAGSGAAYQIAKNKKQSGFSKILLLEQFELLHKNGSSHGNTRITRYSYTDAVYSKMGMMTNELWRVAERESNMSVFKQCGGIDLGHKDDKNIADVINAAKVNNYGIEIYQGKEAISKRFPLLNPPEDYICIFEKNAGLLNAFEAVRMLQWLAVKHGCEIRELEKMLTYETINADTIKVVTNKQVYFTRKLVIAAGAWVNKAVINSYQNMVLPEFDIDVQKMSVAYWKIKKPFRKLWKKMPVWIHYDQSNYDLGAYGFPIFEPEMKKHVKSAVHYPLADEHHIDPDNRSFDSSVEKLSIIKKSITCLFNEEVFEFEEIEEMKKNNKVVTCLYTNTYNTDFIIDNHPANSSIVVFGGGSGHAFKFGPLLGLFLNDLLCRPNTKLILDKFDRSKWSMSNFFKKNENATPSKL